jgi:type II secretory pathway pseudopilin PulG
MFTLIVAVIAVAVVAALSLATLYYGGSAFTHAADQARQIGEANRAGQTQIEAVDPDDGRAGVCPQYDAKPAAAAEMPSKDGNSDWWIALGALGVFMAGGTAGAVAGRLTARE